MTATSAPFGFRPIFGSIGNSSMDMSEFKDGIASGYNTSIGCFDPIKLLTDGTLAKCAATDALVYGIFAGCFYVDSTGRERTSAYWPASTTATKIRAQFWRNPFMELAVQANGTLAQTSVGDESDHVAGTVNTLSGMSTSQLSISLVGAGNSAQFRIVGLYEQADNAWGDTYTIVRVVINESVGFLPSNVPTSNAV